MQTARNLRIIFVHHNLDADEDGALTDAGRLLEIVRPAMNVKAIIYGHTHAWKHDKQDGIHLVNVPAVAYNFKDSEPIGWTDAYFSAKGAQIEAECHWRQHGAKWGNAGTSVA